MTNTGFHVTSAVIGLVFIVLGVLFLLDQLDVITLQARYVVPALIVGLGLAIMAGSVMRRPAS